MVEQWFCTGVRRSFAMTNLRPRDGESFVQARKRLMDLVQAVRAAEPPIPDH